MNSVTITTPAAPHPKARIHAVNMDEGRIRFSWLDENEDPVDSGNSIAPIDTSGGTWPTLSEIRAAVTASTE